MAYGIGESTGHVTDDFTWPERSNRDPSTLKSNIAKTAGSAI